MSRAWSEPPPVDYDSYEADALDNQATTAGILHNLVPIRPSNVANI